MYRVYSLMGLRTVSSQGKGVEGVGEDKEEKKDRGGNGEIYIILNI